MRNIKYIIKASLILLLVLFVALPAGAQELPGPMQPPRMVNDFAGFLDKNSVASLERKVRDFYNSSSTQIYIITVNDLQGYDPSDYATRIGEKWEVGTKGKDNGIVILIKPKTTSAEGEVFISVGYGLEGVIPDITSYRIVDSDIIPSFKAGDFHGGLNHAVETIISLSEGEFTSDQYMQSTESRGQSPIGTIIFIVMMIVLFIGGGSRSRRNGSVGRNLPFFLLLSMMGSGSRSHGGSFGGFSGGGGSFGGFGGGGGGSFGGGGAGGSW